MSYLPTWARNKNAVEGLPSGKEVMETAGLNFDVGLQDIHQKGTKVLDGIPIVGPKIEQSKAVVRLDNNQVLGVVGTKFRPIQNEEFCELFDEIVEKRKLKYFSAGLLSTGNWPTGSRVYMVAKGDKMDIGGDTLIPMSFVIAGHGGSQSLTFKSMFYRLVCLNGQIAEVPGMRSTISIQHSKFYTKRIKVVRKIMETQEIYEERIAELFSKLIQTPMTYGQFADFNKKIYPISSTGKDSLKKRNSVFKKRGELNRLFENGKGMERWKYTRWAAYNAVTEYVDHGPNRVAASTPTNWFDRTMLGTGANLKTKAFSLLTDKIMEPAI